jgi:hypothetical protein
MELPALWRILPPLTLAMLEGRFSSSGAEQLSIVSSLIWASSTGNKVPMNRLSVGIARRMASSAGVIIISTLALTLSIKSSILKDNFKIYSFILLLILIYNLLIMFLQ